MYFTHIDTCLTSNPVLEVSELQSSQTFLGFVFVVRVD